MSDMANITLSSNKKSCELSISIFTFDLETDLKSKPRSCTCRMRSRKGWEIKTLYNCHKYSYKHFYHTILSLTLFLDPDKFASSRTAPAVELLLFACDPQCNRVSAGKIQMSETITALLRLTDAYEIELRGPLEIKVGHRRDVILNLNRNVNKIYPCYNFSKILYFKLMSKGSTFKFHVHIVIVSQLPYPLHLPICLRNHNHCDCYAIALGISGWRYNVTCQPLALYCLYKEQWRKSHKIRLDKCLGFQRYSCQGDRLATNSAIELSAGGTSRLEHLSEHTRLSG